MEKKGLLEHGLTRIMMFGISLEVLKKCEKDPCFACRTGVVTHVT